MKEYEDVLKALKKKGQLTEVQIMFQAPNLVGKNVIFGKMIRKGLIKRIVNKMGAVSYRKL
jgi:hypothetical protein